MALSDIADMSNSGSLRNRILACAAQNGKDTRWTNENLYTICASPSWDTVWANGRAGGVNYNPDTGLRTDVISDQMILVAVQTIVSVQDDAEPHS